MNLTGKDIARRIREHNKIHQHKEPLNSEIITEILEVAAVLFEKVDTGECQIVKHGRWVQDGCGNLVCSNCRWKFSDELPLMSRNLDAKTEEIIGYCMHCGAKMDLKDGKSE